MFIKFESNESAPFVMQSEIAQQLVSMMGQGKDVDGSISGPAISEAISKLQQALARQAEAEVAEPKDDEDEDSSQDEESEQPLPISARAVPLMEMLRAADHTDSFVMWRPE